MSTADAGISIDPVSFVVAAAAAAAPFLKCRDKKKRGGKKGVARKRIRHEVTQIYELRGPCYFRRAYRMTYASFWRLYNMLNPGIKAAREVYYGYKKKGGRAGGNYVDPPVLNGPMSGSARLGCARRYFAGRSLYDIMVKYGCCYQEVLASVWIVVHAVNTFPEFQISYPSSFVEQEKLLKGSKLLAQLDSTIVLTRLMES